MRLTTFFDPEFEFPSLIGRLTTGSVLSAEAYPKQFPSLIGRLTTNLEAWFQENTIEFPSLIGRLTTEDE